MNFIRFSRPAKLFLLLQFICTFLCGGALLSLSARAGAQTTGEATVSSSDNKVSCDQILSPSDAVTSTLKDLYNRGVLTMQDLIAIHNGQNPLETKRGVNGRMYKDVVNTAIVQLMPDQDALEKLDGLIRELAAERGEKNIQAKNTAQTYLPLTMHDIPSGTFMMGNPEWTPDGSFFNRKPHQVRIRRGFRVANFPVTQWQWAKVMGNNPSIFKLGKDSTDVNINGRPVTMKPNYPVENVSWYDVRAFLKVLNAWSKADSPRIYEIIPNHSRFASIKLPTEAQWEYLASRQIAQNENNSDRFTINSDNVCAYGWVAENSQGHTHPVGELRPVISNHSAIYDLAGNVREWTSDWYHVYHGASSPSRAIGRFFGWLLQTDSACKTARGSEINCHLFWEFGLDQRMGINPSSRSGTVGFRVIEVPQ